jgi:hypothetical protein
VRARHTLIDQMKTHSLDGFRARAAHRSHPGGRRPPSRISAIPRRPTSRMCA